MGRSSSSSTSSEKYELSDSDSDHRRPGSSRPRRLPTSNSKNAVAARMNRIKQKQYVKSLEHKMAKLKREINDLKKELDEREKKSVRSRREIAYLRNVISNSPQIGNILRNVRWRNVIPQDERENQVDLPLARVANGAEWALNAADDISTTELFQDTIPPKHVSMCTTLP
ncbi:CREB/ATF bZIP transcription factor-like isoform X4 [Adelges cooleyi]|uniref:CREB/ATF bZIP transcription factor-like isoform X4 n=1 Tax=Adelges cooleyi TaxID=133065 RepID=UPI0021803FFC|nr:CREB/ATF bZIP transcription factor-like isoform X4 [Adelges cooleyi]